MNLAETGALDLPLPGFVQIEPVGQCNLSCRMCPVVYRHEGDASGSGAAPGRGKPPAFMSFDTFRKLLGQYPAIRELHLQGLGEPLLHPRFFDMVGYAAARGIEVSTNTNMTAMSERRAEECVKSGLRRMHVSLDAADPGAYEFIRRGAKYSQVVRNLDRVLAARRALASALPEIHLVVVLMRRNLEQLPGLVRFAAQRGLQGVSVQHLCHDFTESSLPERYRSMREFVDGETLVGEAPERVERWFAEATAAAKEADLPLKLPKMAWEKKAADRRLRCDWPWRGSYVAYSGEAMPCCMVATPDRINFGNMARDGVARVWNNDAYRRFREQLASDEPPEICRGCAVYRGTF